VSATVEIRVPDIGGFADVPVIEVLVKPGDRVKKDDSLITLESDKASMEVPASAGGVVSAVRVKVGDKVSQGSAIVELEPDASDAVSGAGQVGAPSVERGMVTLASGGSRLPDVGAASPVGAQDSIATPAPAAIEPSVAAAPPAASIAAVETAPVGKTDGLVHASPGVRRFARELGLDLVGVRGSGPNGRVTREDVQRFVKEALQRGGGGSGGDSTFPGLPAWPSVDFAQFGEVERAPLSRIKKLSGPNLHRNWLQIPHITNYDEADVTELEAFRNGVNAEQGKSGGVKLTMLAFLVKACVAALQRFPEFNASLDGDSLVLKRYYNIGFAADTPGGLVVPVLKTADSKGLLDIARESAELAGKAREGKLGLGDMQGGSFTISSIGGIGGTQFTQIVNAPEVAILGATRSSIKPVWDGAAFVPRLMLPVSVSYDHRVIDGASAARFLVYLTGLLRDFRRVLL
jgi:pyruvate dehydrogenase E2 component (dihydrolipoamide acetyltransferase)